MLSCLCGILVILAAFFAHKYKIIKLDKSFAIFVSLLGIIGLLISIIVKMNNYIKINKNIQCNLQNMNINENSILKNFKILSFILSGICMNI